jgi:hypothetical protein
MSSAYGNFDILCLITKANTTENLKNEIPYTGVPTLSD